MKRTIHRLLAAMLRRGWPWGLACGFSPGSNAANLSSLETAPVTIDGGFLFHLRGVSAYSAEDRAQVVMQRIVNTARNLAVTRERIVVKALPDRSDIVAGNALVLSIFDVDAELEGVDRPLLAEAMLQQVRDAVDQYRRDRVLKSLATYAAYAVAITIAFALALVVFFLFMRFLNRFAAARHLPAIARRSDTARSPRACADRRRRRRGQDRSHAPPGSTGGPWSPCGSAREVRCDNRCRPRHCRSDRHSHSDHRCRRCCSCAAAFARRWPCPAAIPAPCAAPRRSPRASGARTCRRGAEAAWGWPRAAATWSQA